MPEKCLRSFSNSETAPDNTDKFIFSAVKFPAQYMA